MNRIGSKTNSNLKLQTSNSLLWVDLGRLRRAGNTKYSLDDKSLSIKFKTTVYIMTKNVTIGRQLFLENYIPIRYNTKSLISGKSKIIGK